MCGWVENYHSASALLTLLDPRGCLQAAIPAPADVFPALTEQRGSLGSVKKMQLPGPHP